MTLSFSEDGLYVVTDFAAEGDKTILRSPKLTLPAGKNLCFGARFLLHNSIYGTRAELAILLVPLDQLLYRNITLTVADLGKEARMYDMKYRYLYVVAKLPLYGELTSKCRTNA